ncbi:type III pantothenate kinase [Hymenobacter sp. BT175]|uniref:type III pantothenate kinase n=1 Tax=Hymenobacter translucens TaxID=2886507 RepID=UPI001D0EF773|nr:type III pantothenate kinase [Hymenobacter translucens]MCC2545758.1 type III pantothenate kinase [Hymenobacter translucens]
MRALVLDIGNTAVKYGLFEEAILHDSGTVAPGPGSVEALVQQLRPDHAILASVAEPGSEWVSRVRPFVPGEVLNFVPATTALPIRNSYATPHTLGADRMAAAVGAATLRPGADTLIVDAGTAIKCDWVEGGHTFRGGSIAPGLRLRFQALHTFTGRLPLVDLPPHGDELALTGTDTTSAIRSGVLLGAVAEVNGIIDQYRVLSPTLGVLLAGGDAGFFLPRLKGRIFVIPELVLIGLHRILVHNVER